MLLHLSCIDAFYVCHSYRTVAENLCNTMQLLTCYEVRLTVLLTKVAARKGQHLMLCFLAKICL
jgi:hypothetical protein